MKSIEVGQRDAVVGHQTKGQLVIVFSLAPLAFDVQQGTQVSVHSHVLSSRTKTNVDKISNENEIIIIKKKLTWGLSWTACR